MTTPTPTDSDKRLVTILVDRFEYHWDTGDELAQIIANHYQPEREALMLAKEKLRSIASTYLPSSDDAPDFTLSDMVEKVQDCREQARSALTAIEKVTK